MISLFQRQKTTSSLLGRQEGETGEVYATNATYDIFRKYSNQTSV